MFTELYQVCRRQVVEEQGQRCTPLMIAARNGKVNVVKMLLSKFRPDVEVEGDVNFDGYLIEGASPLWCAAGAGHLKVQPRFTVFFSHCHFYEV